MNANPCIGSVCLEFAVSIALNVKQFITAVEWRWKGIPPHIFSSPSVLTYNTTELERGVGVYCILVQIFKDNENHIVGSSSRNNTAGVFCTKAGSFSIHAASIDVLSSNAYLVFSHHPRPHFFTRVRFWEEWRHTQMFRQRERPELCGKVLGKPINTDFPNC